MYLLSVCFAVFFLLQLQSAFGACSEPLCEWIEAGRLAGLRQPGFSKQRAELRKLYRPRSYSLLWVREGKPTEQTYGLIEAFQSAAAKGLNPEDYDASLWSGRIAKLSDPAFDPARFDLAMTVSLMRYASDLHFGKFNTGQFHPNGERPEVDVAAFVLRLSSELGVAERIAALEPPFEGYRRTQKALATYRILAGKDDEARRLLPLSLVKPGDSYAEVTRLAERLLKFGDLFAMPANSEVYSGVVVDAVRRFQERHGLVADGIIGPATFRELNTPLSHRVMQLRVAMERWRWVPHEFSRPPIVVNIPEFRLRALSLDSAGSYRTEVDMKVVVGKAYNHETPAFAANLTQIIFWPYWHVPRSIVKNELLLEIEKDRSYLMREGYEVVSAQDKVVSTGVLNDATMEQLRRGKFGLRQIPGPHNALGLIKFHFPNRYNVYMHATPSMLLFAKSRRDFSHGCIRVEQPERLAEWALAGQRGWDSKRIEQTTQGNTTIQILLNRPIPILIVYATAVVEPSGEVRFLPDVYGMDTALATRFRESEGRLSHQTY